MAANSVSGQCRVLFIFVLVRQISNSNSATSQTCKTLCPIFRQTMTRQLTLVFLLTSLLCNGQTFKSRLDSLVHKYDSLGSYNGVIIVAFRPDSIVTFEYGYKDPTTKAEKISINDRFYLASLSKQITGLTVLQLIDKGKIKADDPIGKYIPELKPALQKVTVQQLANHTNGIHDFHTLTSKHDSLDNKKILAMLSKLDSTVFVPGTKWGYSNSGYILLSILVERVTKTSFPNYCTKNVLSPLNMKSVCFVPATKKVLTGYSTKLEPEKFTISYSGPEGLYASGADIIAYYKTVCKKPDYWKKYFTMSYDLAENSNEKGWTYGFGFFFTEDDFGKFRAHSGNHFGFYNYIRWYEKTNTFICLLSNKNDDFIKKLREDVATLVKTQLKK